MDTTGLISLKHIVSSYQNETGDYSPSNYKRLMQLAIEGYSDLNIFYSPALKTEYIVVTDINTINVPEDYVDYVRIGLIVDGSIWTLTKNNNIPLLNSISCGEDDGDTDNQVSPRMQFDWHYSFAGGTNIGMYRYDPEYRRIVLSGDLIGQTAVLEYISSGVSCSGMTWVPREAGEVIKEYIYWKSIQRTDSAVSQKELAMRNYNFALAKYMEMAYSFTVDEFLDAVRSGEKQTVKK